MGCTPAHGRGRWCDPRNLLRSQLELQGDAFESDYQTRSCTPAICAVRWVIESRTESLLRMRVFGAATVDALRFIPEQSSELMVATGDFLFRGD